MGCGCGSKPQNNNLAPAISVNKLMQDKIVQDKMNIGVSITGSANKYTILNAAKSTLPGLVRFAAVLGLGLIDERVFDKGLNSAGTSISPQGYSTRAAVIDISQISTARAAIDRIKKVSAATKKPGERYFWGEGYTDLRKALGLQTNYVDLQLTGQFRLDWNLIPLPNNEWGLGFPNPRSQDVLNDLTHRFGTFMLLTDDEFRYETNEIIKHASKLLK